VARGQLREDAAFYTGRDAAGAFLAGSPVEITDALRARGAQRYAIYCQPCHDRRGNGKGILFERGGVPTPSFHEERLRTIADGEIFDVVTHGKGLMPPYAYPVPPADRWAIIAHLRELQRQAASAELAQARPPAEGQP
jgi:mono/diheme cytochrome c family protein